MKYAIKDVINRIISPSKNNKLKYNLTNFNILTPSTFTYYKYIIHSGEKDKSKKTIIKRLNC